MSEMSQQQEQQQNDNQEQEILTSRLQSGDEKIIQDSLTQIIQINDIKDQDNIILTRCIELAKQHISDQIGLQSLKLILKLFDQEEKLNKVCQDNTFIDILLQYIIQHAINNQIQDDFEIQILLKLANQKQELQKLIFDKINSIQNNGKSVILESLIKIKSNHQFQILTLIIEQLIKYDYQYQLKYIQDNDIINQLFLQVKAVSINTQQSNELCKMIQVIINIQIDIYLNKCKQEEKDFVQNNILQNIKIFNDLYQVIIYTIVKNGQIQSNITSNLIIVSNIIIGLMNQFNNCETFINYIINSKIFDFSIIFITNIDNGALYQNKDIFITTLSLINQMVQLNERAQVKFAISITVNSQQVQQEVLYKITQIFINSEDKDISSMCYNILINVLTKSQSLQLSVCASLSKYLRQSRKGSWQDGLKIIAKVFAIKQETKAQQILIEDSNVKSFVQVAQKQIRQNIEQNIEKAQYELSQQAIQTLYSELAQGTKKIVECATLFKNLLVNRNNCYHFAISCINVEQLKQLGSNQQLITDNINNDLFIMLLDLLNTNDTIQQIKSNQLKEICLQLLLHLNQDSVELVLLPACHSQSQMNKITTFLQTNHQDNKLQLIKLLFVINMPQQMYNYFDFKEQFVLEQLSTLQQLSEQFDQSIQKYIQNNSEIMKTNIQNKFTMTNSLLSSQIQTKDKFVSIEEYNKLKQIINQQNQKIQYLQQLVEQYEQQLQQNQQQVEMPPQVTPQQLQKLNNKQDIQENNKQEHNEQQHTEQPKPEDLFVPQQE